MRKGGEVFWAIVTITSIHDAFGQHVGFANVTRDITERKRAEDALRLSESGFRAMANAVPVVIWVTDPTGACVFVNEPNASFYRLIFIEIVSRPFAVEIRVDWCMLPTRPIGLV